MLRLLPVLLLGFALPKATIPTSDKPGARDHSLLKRYEGSYIVFSERRGFASFNLPLSKLEPVPGKKVGNNNRAHEPKNKKTLEGEWTRLVYILPANRSPLEVSRNYQDEIRARGGRVLFECQGGACGGDERRSSGGGGGDASLAMYLYPAERITEPHGSSGYCAMAERIRDQAYTAGEIPSAGAHVSVLTYTTVAPDAHDPCVGFNGRTIAVVDVLETKAREQKMVAVNASEMANAIAGTGKVTLYGIYFDFNRTDIKPESDATLEEIGKLLKSSPAMRLIVVGHTDNVGTFAFNRDLSQRRASAVVDALSSRFGVRRDRLTPFGVSFAAPVASNRTEDGRAKNRRVELVENSSAASR